MAISLELPRGADAIAFLCSFAPSFSSRSEMQNALLGVEDSLRQASILPLEPLGMFSCITAEEEAASFLYGALICRGHSIPDYGKMRNHVDKVRIVVFGLTLFQYFFGRPALGVPSVIHLERDGPLLKTSQRYPLGEYIIVQEDPLETIVTLGEHEDGHDAAVAKAVRLAVTQITPSGYTVQSNIKRLANIRNLCLYGAPANKPRFQSQDQIERYRSNCVCLIVLGFLVLNSSSKTSSMQKLVTLSRNIIFS